MVNLLYGDGSLYNSGDLYGRINAGLAVASEAHVRQTGLRVRVIDEQLNKWEHFAGTQAYGGEVPLGVGLYLPVNTVASNDIRSWGLRGGSHMARLSGGDIIRVRNGNPANAADRQVWIQTITDPTIAAQWTAWSVLYSGTHYGTPTVQPTGATTYDIYHAKSDGLYKNNVQIWANDVDHTALYWLPTEGDPLNGWAVAMREHPLGGPPVYNLYWSADVDNFTPAFDSTVNYAWSKVVHLSIVKDDAVTVARFLATPLHFNPRNSEHGIELWTVQSPLASADDIEQCTAPYSIRGIGGGGGINYILFKAIKKLADGYYYLFASEVHKGALGVEVSSLGIGIPIWMRSKDLKHWSEPVVGPPVKNGWGMGGIVEAGGYLYYSDTEVVYRRPTAVVEYDITNYVPRLSFELPRDNQPGSGQVAVANPEDVHANLRTLADSEIIIEPGLKTATGQYELVEFDKFFIKQHNRQMKGKVDRIELTITNVWGRLNTQFRDVINFVGQFSWDDFKVGARNEPFNYYFLTDTAPTITSASRLSSRGIALYTGWKGINPDITAHFYGVTGDPTIILRYLDENNYIAVEKSGSTLKVYERVAGVNTDLDSSGVGSDTSPKIRARLVFNHLWVWHNDTLIFNFILSLTDWNILQPGYVGFKASRYQIGDFHLSDWEAALTMEDLIRSALAMGDFHDVIVGGATSRAYALIWGPQTDNDSAASGLKQILTTEKLQMIWRDGSVEVGRFNEQSPVRTISNEIIDADNVEEPDSRINLASVDGNEHFWLEVDTEDANRRGHMIIGYYDLPELLDRDSVIARAREEIKRSSQGSSPGGTTPLFFDLCRMDAINWVLPDGTVELVRIEGFSVDIDQSMAPHQRQTFDLSRYSDGSTDALMDGGTP